MGPSLQTRGYALTVLSGIFFLFASYITLFHLVIPPADASILATMADDAHYKYFVALLVPTGTCFVIANWVGWQYYRNA